jgi:hypothetical protein
VPPPKPGRTRMSLHEVGVDHHPDVSAELVERWVPS